MKFICDNPECPRCGVVEEEWDNVYKLVDGELVSNKAPCPCCGGRRREISDGVPLSEKNIQIGGFTSASPERRREMLKKRAHDHYEKEIKPFKEHQLHEAVSAFKSVK